MKPKLCTESWLALGIGLVFGTLAVLLVPPAVTFDGPSHYFRSLQISEGHFRAERYSERAVGGTVPEAHADFIHTLWNSYWVSHDFGTPGSWSALSAKDGKLKGTSNVEFTNTAVYSPANYLFQALGMRIAGVVSDGPLTASRLGCLFNLLGYLLLVIAALEITPRFRAGILLLALSPLILIQAASLSADAINFSLPLFFLAWAWRLRSGESARPGAELASLLAVGIAVVLLKPTAIVMVACLWLLPPSVFPSKAAKAGIAGLYFVCALGVWYAWNKPNLSVDIARWFEPNRAPASVQRDWFLGNPARFVGSFLDYLQHGVIPQLPLMFGGVGGWISDSSLRFMTPLSVIFLIGFFGCGPGAPGKDKVWAFGIMILAAGILLVTALTLWLAFGTTGVANVPMFVGRYLLPIVLCLGIACAELQGSGIPKVRRGLFWAALAANCAGLTAIIVSIGSRVA